MKKLIILSIFGLIVQSDINAQYNGRERDRDQDRNSGYDQRNRQDDNYGRQGQYDRNNPYNDPNYYPNQGGYNNGGYNNGYDNHGQRCNTPPPPQQIYVPGNYCRPVVINPYIMPYNVYSYGYNQFRGHHGHGYGHHRRW